MGSIGSYSSSKTTTKYGSSKATTKHSPLASSTSMPEIRNSKENIEHESSGISNITNLLNEIDLAEQKVISCEQDLAMAKRELEEIKEKVQKQISQVNPKTKDLLKELLISMDDNSSR